jgi:hypothetical protein
MGRSSVKPTKFDNDNRINFRPGISFHTPKQLLLVMDVVLGVFRET